MSGQARALRVLVVEGNDAHAQLAVRVLESAGYACARATNAERALELIAASAPDLVLMDLILPGISGLEAIGRLRAAEATRSVRIIAVTSYRSDFPARDCSLTGADGYIAKPYHYADLIDLAHEVLQRPREKSGGGGNAEGSNA